MLAWQGQLQQLTNKLVHSDRRLLVLVEGDADWALETVQVALAGLGAESVLWYSTRSPAGAWTLPADRYNHELGREAQQGVFDAYSGFNPDALAALCGNIRGGGCVWVLCPPLDEWPRFADPFARKIAVEPWGVARVRNRFTTRAAWILRQYPYRAHLYQRSGTCAPGLSVPQLPDLPVQQRRVDDAGCVTDCQRTAMELILKVIQGHRKRPLVIEVDRGRGKSVALGLAVARLAEAGKRIVITAPRVENAETLLRFARPHPDRPFNAEFYAPDRLLQVLPKADLLMVDEAAAIAPHLLKRILSHYSRAVMATTVNGYEGTGRGFSVRFHQHLNQQFPDWVRHEMRQPVRWQEQDWLEGLLQKLLLLKPQGADNIDPGGHPSLQFGEFTYQCDDHAEAQLNQLFELLMSAHYRTRPSDLRSMLDGGNVRLFTLRDAHQVYAVAMVACEGELGGNLAEHITEGKRRPHGQVLPQSLAVHLGQAQALGMCHWRIVRIAVQPQLQGTGLGSELLAHLLRQARAEGADGIGSLFSGSAAVLQFWHKNEYACIRVGYQREATTGAHSLLVYQGLSDGGQAMVQAALTGFHEDLPIQLMLTHQQLPASLVLQLCARHHSTVPATLPNHERDQQALQRFLAGYTPYENAAAAVWRSLWSLPISGLAWDQLPESERKLVIMKVLQNHPWPHCISTLQLTGIKQARKLLRQALARGFHWTLSN
ncbi:MAG TPA: hypothetical protein DCS92_07685 [Gammaproteobacteria bacterium]|nr:hypothetical protein [Gammaproteobacteria bacterium]